MSTSVCDSVNAPKLAKSLTAFVGLWLFVVADSCLQAEEAPPGEPTEFETAPSVVLRESTDILSIAVSPVTTHLYVGLHDGSVMTVE